MNNNVPLAEELRPKILDEIVGQLEILGEGQSLKVAIESSKLPSMILWGPPGVGKTTIARVIANTTDSELLAFKIPHPLGVGFDVADAEVNAEVNEPLTTRDTNNVSPPLLK